MKMGFNIENRKDVLIIRPSLLSGLFGHKVIIDKSSLKKGTKIAALEDEVVSKPKKIFDIEGVSK